MVKEHSLEMNAPKTKESLKEINKPPTQKNLHSTENIKPLTSTEEIKGFKKEQGPSIFKVVKNEAL
jgi:hypothetical protein